jgi:hypothetical protein
MPAQLEIIPLGGARRLTPSALARYPPKLILTLLLAGSSAIVAERVRLATRAGGGLTPQLGELLSFLVSWFFVLLCLAALTSLFLFLANSDQLKLTPAGLLYAVVALALWYLGMVCLLFAVNLWILESIGHFLIGCMAGGCGLLILPKGAACFALAKRHMLRGADEILRDGTVAPILYLRSFADDDAVTTEESLRNYDTGKAWSLDFYTEQRPRAFEEIMCGGLSLVAPVVALERPGNRLPPLGAARKSVPSRDWKGVVELLLSRCRFAVLVVGNSEGLFWEFERLLSEPNPNKILLALPAHEDRDEIWRSLARRLAGSKAHALLPEELPPDTLAMAFRTGWRPVVFTGARRSSGVFREIAEWVVSKG